MRDCVRELLQLVNNLEIVCSFLVDDVRHLFACKNKLFTNTESSVISEILDTNASSKNEIK